MGTALLVIDMQNDFCHEQGAMGVRGADVEGLQRPVAVIERLIAAAKAAGHPVFFIRTEHGRFSDSAIWRSRLKGAASVERVPVCVPGTWGADFYGLDAKEADHIVTKHRYSAFVATELELLLRASGVDEVVCTGVATNVCVESTARDAAMREFRCTVVSDACAASSAAEHESALFNLGTYFCRVQTAEECMRAWAK